MVKSAVWKKRILWNYSSFQRTQKRDTNIWFGADNPWIKSPPDFHACMPGLPDDEANTPKGNEDGGAGLSIKNKVV